MGKIDYDLKTDMDGDYFNVVVEPDGNTDVGDLAGQWEQHQPYEGEINGYEMDVTVTDEALEIQIDTTTGDQSPEALVDTTEEIRQYLDDTTLPDDFVDQFSGGQKKGLSHDYK